MKTEDRPRLQILAGVNGAGKSTLYDRVFDQRQPFVNPDLIARAIAPDNVNDPRVSLQAGREAVRQTNRLLADRHSFALETTLSSQQALKTLARAKAAGFHIELHYVGLINKEESIDRVAQRVKKGGHDIPRDALERRYDKSMNHLPAAMLLARHIELSDNSDEKHQLLYQRTGDKLLYQAEHLPEWADTAIRKYELARGMEKEIGKQGLDQEKAAWHGQKVHHRIFQSKRETILKLHEKMRRRQERHRKDTDHELGWEK